MQQCAQKKGRGEDERRLCYISVWAGLCASWFTGSAFRLPVCSQSGGYISSRDLRHDVAPEKRSVNQSHRLWIPVELGFLVQKKTVQRPNYFK